MGRGYHLRQKLGRVGEARLRFSLERSAEDIGRACAEEASDRLRGVAGSVEIKASLVLVDDVGGGWTNRYTTEAQVRFPRRGALSRPFARG